MVQWVQFRLADMACTRVCACVCVCLPHVEYIPLLFSGIDYRADATLDCDVGAETCCRLFEQQSRQQT